MRIERVPTVPDPFARQCLIPGWDQERVSSARVLIAGVGALGNACAADLALTGFRNFILVDFDEIETSNLSRTILFRRGDEGRTKVGTGADRLREMVLFDDPHVVPISADVVWDLGAGIYRRVDLIFGCVDSAEARAAVGARGIEVGVPTIFGGIYGYDGSVMVQGDRGGSCIACSFGPGERASMGQRYSCDQVRRALVQEGKFPTTQVLSAIVSGFMVQEALKVLHGERGQMGSRIFVAGRWPTIERFSVPKKASCPFHAGEPKVQEMPGLSSRSRAGEVVELLGDYFGEPATVDLGRDFLLGGLCKGCGREIDLHRPRHRVFETDLVCETCRSSGCEIVGNPRFEVVREIDAKSPPAALEMTLGDLGVPPLHLLRVRAGETASWVELTGDAPRVLPGWPEGAQE